jgi:hypothetical protein
MRQFVPDDAHVAARLVIVEQVLQKFQSVHPIAPSHPGIDRAPSLGDVIKIDVLTRSVNVDCREEGRVASLVTDFERFLAEQRDKLPLVSKENGQRGEALLPIDDFVTAVLEAPDYQWLKAVEG